jgi:anaerobic magnesium-protoporphyrin IX monomethyl ester cyclase
MSEILLINPPFTRSEEYRFCFSCLGTKSNPALGLASIAAVCLERGLEVEIVDALAEGLSWERLRERIIKANPRIVGVTATTPMINNAFKTVDLVKGCNLAVLTVLGGPHITAEAVLTMNECLSLDVGVIGEGEDTFTELAECVLSSNLRRIEDIRGIVYRQDGKIITNSVRPFIDDINNIPWPAYHLLPMKLYSPSP